jgi:hypothetical protein
MYIIVLFKNKVKKKIIKEFKTIKKAQDYYKSLMDVSDTVIFNKQFDNGYESNYELGFLEPKTVKTSPLYVKDDFGRQIKIEMESGDNVISKINPYNIDEVFLDYTTKKKINTTTFIKKYLDPVGLKLVSKLNNKIIVQHDDSFKLFTFKNDNDSSRFIDSILSHFIKLKRIDCLFVKDYDNSQRKYLYSLLVEQGFSKSYLFRQSTTHPTKK